MTVKDISDTMCYFRVQFEFLIRVQRYTALMACIITPRGWGKGRVRGGNIKIRKMRRCELAQNAPKCDRGLQDEIGQAFEIVLVTRKRTGQGQPKQVRAQGRDPPNRNAGTGKKPKEVKEIRRGLNNQATEQREASRPEERHWGNKGVLVNEVSVGENAL
jgi:hypothetical protein